MSAIREVKYLRELKHQNVIEVRLTRQVSSVRLKGLLAAFRRFLLKNESQSRIRVPRLGFGKDH